MVKTKKTRSASRSSDASGGPLEAFEWKEPPPRTRSSSFNFPAEKLKGKKGTWALVKTTTSPAGSATSYLKKQLEARGETGFEVVSRGNEIFARYTGK